MLLCRPPNSVKALSVVMPVACLGWSFRPKPMSSTLASLYVFGLHHVWPIFCQNTASLHVVVLNVRTFFHTVKKFSVTKNLRTITSHFLRAIVTTSSPNLGANECDRRADTVSAVAMAHPFASTISADVLQVYFSILQTSSRHISNQTFQCRPAEPAETISDRCRRDCF